MNTRDECQALGTEIWTEVLSECKAPYRIGLSATPKRSDFGTIKLMADTGPILFNTTAARQIENKRLCELNIKYHVFDHKLYNENDSNIQYAEAVNECIVNNASRNQLLVEEALTMVNEGRYVLTLVQYIEHGHLLKQKFIENNVSPEDIMFVWGDTPDKIRKNAIAEFRKGNFKIMIGSTIFDAGVNIPAISGVVLCGAGNSEITLIQRIGRGARNCDYEQLIGELPEFMKQSHGQKVTKVVDILDMNVKFFEKQARNRMKNAKEEFGNERVSVIGTIPRKKAKKSSGAQRNFDQMQMQLDMIEKFRTP